MQVDTGAAFEVSKSTRRIQIKQKPEKQEAVMKRILCGSVFLLASLGLAQQGQPPQASPPYTTPPTFPQEQTPRDQMPPDQEAPPTEQMSSTKVQQQIEQHLNAEPALTNSNVGVKTDDQSVVLTGTVDTPRQHDLALQIARSYAGERRIVDKIKSREHA